MKQVLRLTATTSLIALFAAGTANAQTALVGIEGLDDQIDSQQEAVADEFAKSEDANRFGTAQFGQGWSGSLSASTSATTGNTDTVDFSLAGRLNYGTGLWNHAFGVAAEYGEANGVRNDEEIYATYEANRYLDEKFYLFGIGSVRYDDFDSNRFDSFIGFGPGYRVVNNSDFTWRVQAGPGVRYIEDQNGNDSTDIAGLASSRVYYKINETVFLTNDTDVLFSQEDAVLTNEFGINFAVTDTLTTRLGLRTEYDTDPLPGLKSTDNSLTAAIVVGF